MADLDAHSILGMVVFILVMVVVIHPVRIRIPLALSRPIVAQIGRWNKAEVDLQHRYFVPIGTATAPCIGVLVLLASKSISFSVVGQGIAGEADGVKPYSIMLLFLSLAYISLSLDNTGLLQFLAFWVMQKAARKRLESADGVVTAYGSGRLLFASFYILFTLIAVIVGNDPVILSGTAFLAYFTRVAGIDDTSAFIFGEFMAANIGSMVLFIGNPTNLVVAEAFSINFATYTAFMILPAMAASVAGLGLQMLQFRKPKHIPPDIPAPDVVASSVLLDRPGAIFGSILLTITLTVLIATSFFRVDVWIVALPCGLVMLCREVVHDFSVNAHILNPPIELNSLSNGPEPQTRHTSSLSRYQKIKQRFPNTFTTLARLPLSLVPFAFGMFILVQSLDYLNWITLFSSWLVIVSTAIGAIGTCFVVGFVTTVLCNVAGTNIGATILITKCLQSPAFQLLTANNPRLSRGGLFAIAFASNTGAFSFCVQASLAGLLWRTILRSKNIYVSAGQFAKWNLLPTAVVTTVGLAVIVAEICIIYPVRL